MLASRHRFEQLIALLASGEWGYFWASPNSCDRKRVFKLTYRGVVGC